MAKRQQISTGNWRVNPKGCPTSRGLPVIESANGHLVVCMATRNLADAQAMARSVKVLESAEALLRFLESYPHPLSVDIWDFQADLQRQCRAARRVVRP